MTLCVGIALVACPPVILVRPTSSSPTHRFRKLVSPIGDLIGLGINPQRIRVIELQEYISLFDGVPLPRLPGP